jgi:hypothetical protein
MSAVSFPDSEHTTGVQIRYVLVDPLFGVYLGNTGGTDRWSKNPVDEKEIKSAPTFTRDEAEAVGKEVCDRTAVVLDLQAHECVAPDMPDKRASVSACADAGLPRWGE